MIRPLPLLPLCLALVACPPAIDLGDDGGGVITAGPEGGIFVREGAIIDIPRGALADKQFITVTIIDSGIPEVPGRKRVSLGYRFSPSSLTFKEPVKIIIPYLEVRVPQGVDPGTFDLRRSSATDPYLQLPGAAAHPEFTVVEAQSERLGLFWATSPAQAAVSKITIDPVEVFLNVGDTQQFTAQVTDPAGNRLEVPVAWSLVAPRVASIDAAGLLTATGPGPATVTARAASASASATASVHVQGSATGPKSFIHENPFPTGNDLWGGTLASGAAVFVGANATVLVRSPTDEWTRVASNTGITLKAAGGSTPENAAAVGISGTTGVLVELKGASAAPVISMHTSVVPRAMWFDGTHGMAVGEGNDVLVRRAGAWVKEYSPSIETLLAVIGDGQGAFTTLGNRGSLYAYDPVTRTWNSLFQTQLAVLLSAGALANAQGSEAWAAGGGKLWHFSSGAWAAVNLPATPVTSELTALGLIDGRIVVGARAGKQGYLVLYDPLWAGGDAGTPDGGEDGGAGPAGPWSAVSMRGPQIIRGIFGQAADGYAVGDFGAVWRYAAGTFTEVSRGFYGNVADVAVSGSSVFAAVNECETAACSKRIGKVMSRTGPSSWAPLGSSQPFDAPLFSVTATSATEVLAGGDGVLFRYDGTAWSPASVLGGGGPIFDLQVCGTSVYGAGARGQAYKGTATSIAVQSTLGSGDVRAVHCPTDAQVWMAGDDGLFEKNGAGSFFSRTSASVNHGPWRAVWSPGQGEAFAFGAARYGVYWDTSDLTVFDAPGGILPDVLTGLWGSSADNLYAVGHSITPFPFGYAVRFNGVQWLPIDSGSQRKLTSIHGSSATEVWLGTEGGGLLRAVP